MSNPVKFFPLFGEEIVDEGDDETLDAAIAGARQGRLIREAREREEADKKRGKPDLPSDNGS